MLACGALPVFRDEVTLTTFCSGTGSRWAERRTTLEADGGVRVEAVALWVFVDPAGRPVPLEDWFLDLYGKPRATGGSVAVCSIGHLRSKESKSGRGRCG